MTGFIERHDVIADKIKHASKLQELIFARAVDLIKKDGESKKSAVSP